MNELLLPLLVAAAAGGLVVLLAFPVLLKYRKDEKARLLKSMVKDAGKLAAFGDDSDPVAAAKRAAEERALLEQLRGAVQKLAPPSA